MSPSRAVRLRPLLLAGLVVAALAASAPTALAAPPSAQVLAPPSPVLGTDGSRHLVYEIELENTSEATVAVERLVVRDGVRRTPLSGVDAHVGDRVRRGEVLGRVGNSGGSSEPHLHFHLIDAAGGPSALGGNALPFVFDAFHYTGAIRDFETGEFFPAPAPAVRHGQLPLTGDITDF